VPVHSIRVIKAQMAFARVARLDSVMVWDHFQDFTPTVLWDQDWTWMAKDPPSPHEFFDYQTLLGNLAGRAGRVRLGVGVTEPIRRHPVVIAQAMATLAHLTNRAPILGLGAGERVNTHPYGLSFSHPVDRLEEALQIIRMCFCDTRPLTFDGRHFQLHGARMDLIPPPGRVPQIWIGAHGPRMLELAGRFADGWYPTGVTTPQEYAGKLALIHEAAVAAGRDPQAIIPSLQAYPVVAPTVDEAQAIVHSRPARFLALYQPASVWQQSGHVHPLGLDRGLVDLHLEDRDRPALDAVLDAVPEELLALNPSGTPDQIVDYLRGFADAGMRHVSLMFASTLYSQRAALYGLRATRHIARALH
jgi:phthiodiolone/phenolphthiodiolone dimycocerosates ketoreductase